MNKTISIKKIQGKGLGYHFIPVQYQRAHILMWLKRLHAWTGIWGATLFLLIGISGILLNHRSILAIDTGAPTETFNVTIPVEAAKIPSMKAFEAWLRDQLSIKSGTVYASTTPAQKVVFENKIIMAPETWKIDLYGPNSTIVATYTHGTNSVNAHATANTLLGILKNLHMGNGLGVVWVLFFDMLAGALLFMSITGILLWSKLHGTRVLGAGLLFGSIIMALLASVPYMVSSTL